MDRIQELINSQNNEIQYNEKLNPMRLYIGQFVTVKDSGVYKLTKFSKNGKEVVATVWLIYSADGVKQSKPKPVTVEIDKVKPAVILIKNITDRINNLINLKNFLQNDLNTVSFSQMFDNNGNIIK